MHNIILPLPPIHIPIRKPKSAIALFQPIPIAALIPRPIQILLDRIKPIPDIIPKPAHIPIAILAQQLPHPIHHILNKLPLVNSLIIFPCAISTHLVEEPVTLVMATIK